MTLTEEAVKEIVRIHVIMLGSAMSKADVIESAIREALELVEKEGWLPSIEQVEEKLLVDVPGKRQVDSAMRQGFRGCYDWIISLSPTTQKGKLNKYLERYTMSHTKQLIVTALLIVFHGSVPA